VFARVCLAVQKGAKIALFTHHIFSQKNIVPTLFILSKFSHLKEVHIVGYEK
jgi:hypothetical protein